MPGNHTRDFTRGASRGGWKRLTGVGEDRTQTRNDNSFARLILRRKIRLREEAAAMKSLGIKPSMKGNN